MTQQQLDQQVADATGESLEEIKRRGFSEIESIDEYLDRCWIDHNEYPPVPPQYIDWDALERKRNVPVYDPPRCPW